MVGWRKLALVAAGFGGGFAIVLASIVGIWAWYQGRLAKPKQWDSKAIVAAFDYPDIESGEPEGPNGFRPDVIVLYYTLENMTDVDYDLPSQEQLEIDARLKREKSLSGNAGILTLDKERIFIPARQRRRVGVHLHYPVTQTFGPDAKTEQEHRRKWKLIAEYMTKEFTNLDGFVVFDSKNHYEINLPNGWGSMSEIENPENQR